MASSVFMPGLHGRNLSFLKPIRLSGKKKLELASKHLFFIFFFLPGKQFNLLSKKKQLIHHPSFRVVWVYWPPKPLHNVVTDD